MLSNAYLFLLIALLMPIVFLILPARAGARDKLPWYDILVASITFGIPFYFFLNAGAIISEAWELKLSLPAYIAALVFWAITIEGARRAGGGVFALFILLFSLNPLFAGSMPGMLRATSQSLWRLASYYMVGGEAIVGLPMDILGKLLVGFLLFGATLVATGAAKPFLNFSLALLGTARGGPAKVAVVASGIVGSITGSPGTNIIIVGSFTIPAMKRTGYPAHYAAGIEACASTGGVLMPPIMGATAFIVAGFLGITYASVCVAAIVPSILYYLGLFVQIDGHAANAGLIGLSRKELPSLRNAIKEILIYAIGILVLVFMLLYLRRESQAPFYATACLLCIAMIRRETRLGWRDFVSYQQNAGKLIAEVTALLLGVGLVLGSIYITGVANTMSVALIDLSGGNVYLLILLGALASFIMGMGLSILACYVLLAILLAPGLIQGGLDPLAVHLFIMYCGMLSFITPPVALAAYIAASLAQANPMKTGVTACRLGAILFIIPLFFVLNPALILHGTPLEIFQAVGTGIVGVVILASGLEGYMIGLGRLSLVPRAIALISGILIFYPSWISEIIGGGIFIVFIGIRFLVRRVSLKQ